MDVTELSDQEISERQNALSAEANRRLRVVYIPQQISEIVRDARAGKELSDTEIRDVFETAMNADID